VPVGGVVDPRAPLAFGLAAPPHVVQDGGVPGVGVHARLTPVVALVVGGAEHDRRGRERLREMDVGRQLDAVAQRDAALVRTHGGAGDQ
jgi:hypothetical protein